MPDPRTDQIAREAARLIETGRSENIDSAIRAAAENPHLRGAALPAHSRVRKHAQAMSMQSLGDAAYNQQRIKVWRIAEQIMSALEHAIPEARTLLVGRAAKGHIDAGASIHIRIYTEISISRIAQTLVQFGSQEPVFLTAETIHGRLSRIRFNEESIEVVLTRCPTALATQTGIDLHTGKPIERLDLNDLRNRLQQAETDTQNNL